jgi:hypothetical protein
MSRPPLPSAFALRDIAPSRSQARVGIDDLKALLDNSRMDERRDILPLFRSHPDVGALLGLIHFIDVAQSRLVIGHEVALGFFRADLVVADIVRNHYLLVEFEHGHEDSIFTKTPRSTPVWSRAFERGYGQIVDWFWWLARSERTIEFGRLFLRETPTITGLLVIGRDFREGEAELRERLRWRMEYSVINSRKIYVSTYDELYRALDANWHTLPPAPYASFPTADEP